MLRRDEQNSSRTGSEEASRLSASYPAGEPSLKLLGLNFCWKESFRGSIWQRPPSVFKGLIGQPSILWFAEVCLL